MFDRRQLLQCSLAASALGAGLLPTLTRAADVLPQGAQVTAILAASDKIRNPAGTFGTRIAVTEYRNKKVEDEGNIVVFAQLDKQIEQYDSLVRILAPRRDRGKLLLKTAQGNEVWFYDPAVKTGMRISPQQRLLGQAANGDVVSVNLAKEYKAVVEAAERISDGDRVERLCWRLKLSNGSAAVTYPALTYWVEQGSNRPVKAQFFADSGRLLKTAYYRRFEDQLGAERPAEVVIIDGVNTELLTVLRYSDFRAETIPSNWFTREGLPLVREQ